MDGFEAMDEFRTLLRDTLGALGTISTAESRPPS
jgi:hypothetical protein